VATNGSRSQDMRLMGGLRKHMPVTADRPFQIGLRAISGNPSLAGFWARNGSLGQAFNAFPLLLGGGLPHRRQ